MPYTTEHAGAVADLTAAGTASLVFTRRSPGTEGTDGTFAGATTSLVRCVGMQVKGDPQEYAGANLTMHHMTTLLVAPTTYGVRAYSDRFLLPGDTVPYLGQTFTVRAVLSVVAPDGVVLLARVAVSV